MSAISEFLSVQTIRLLIYGILSSQTKKQQGGGGVNKVILDFDQAGLQGYTFQT